MELGLSLGDASEPFAFFPKDRQPAAAAKKSIGFCMALGINSIANDKEEQAADQKAIDGFRDEEDADADDLVSEESQFIKLPSTNDKHDQTASVQQPHTVVQLDLLPVVPVSRQTHAFPWSSDNGSSGSSGNVGMPTARGFDVNRLPLVAPEEVSSPNSAGSSFQIDFSIFRGGNASCGRGSKRDSDAAGNFDAAAEAERASSRASDEDENGLTRKKLRLSKEQSAYLEESFKEHNTLNPKQKLSLAKQLNLRPRQVEVWFQNRRARTKLKQTEVDCEYLKRCCETLTEENRRLHKELQELRALKTSNPFYMQLPATTLTMCPSCERVATTSTPPLTTTGATATTTTNMDSKAVIPFPPSRPRFHPFSHSPTHPHQPAAS